MTREEWEQAVEALEICFDNVKTLFLFNKHIIEPYAKDYNHVYTYYYNNIADHLLEKLEILTKWAGTGLDKEVGYDAHLIERIANNLLVGCPRLNYLHKKHVKKAQYEVLKNSLEEFHCRTRKFFSDPGLFCPECEQYLDRIIIINNGTQNG
jgi:hypothetical protein